MIENLPSELDTEYQSLRNFMKLAVPDGDTAQLLRMALREELTARQLQFARMYYLEQHTMSDIAKDQGVNVSTVSRSLKSARTRLRRCMKYANKGLLRHTLEDDDW